MMREITGMLVTAIAIANTSRNDVELPFGPHMRCRFTTCRMPMPATKGDDHPGQEHGADGLALVAVKHPPDLGAGDEQEQQQAELVHGGEHRRRRSRRREEPRLRRRREVPEHGQAQEQSADHLADRARLAEAHEHRAHRMRRQQQGRQRHQDMGDIRRL